MVVEPYDSNHLHVSAFERTAEGLLLAWLNIVSLAMLDVWRGRFLRSAVFWEVLFPSILRHVVQGADGQKLAREGCCSSICRRERDAANISNQAPKARILQAQPDKNGEGHCR